jgi:hypothetical protein
MAKTKTTLGIKFTCFKCTTKYYDLNKQEPVCPECGADQREDPTPLGTEDTPPAPRSAPASSGNWEQLITADSSTSVDSEDDVDDGGTEDDAVEQDDFLD